MHRARFLLRRWMCIVVLVTVASCGQQADLSSPTARQMRDLAAVYLDFAAARGQGPANEQQLRQHLRNVPAFLVEASGINSQPASRTFVSERDGEPLVIRYGVGISQKTAAEAPVIACEKKGKDGTRYIAFANGHVACVDEVAAKELMRENL
jgi:hypothetical protein